MNSCLDFMITPSFPRAFGHCVYPNNRKLSKTHRCIPYPCWGKVSFGSDNRVMSKAWNFPQQWLLETLGSPKCCTHRWKTRLKVLVSCNSETAVIKYHKVAFKTWKGKMLPKLSMLCYTVQVQNGSIAFLSICHLPMRQVILY